jgi:hypothetical protein
MSMQVFQGLRNRTRLRFGTGSDLTPRRTPRPLRFRTAMRRQLRHWQIADQGPIAAGRAFTDVPMNHAFTTRGSSHVDFKEVPA